MPGFNRVHGTTSAASSFASGYEMTILKIADSGSGFTADSVSNNEITEGGFVQALRVVQTIASIVYVGTRANAQFVVIVDGITAGQTGLAYNSDTTPTIGERVKAELEDVFGATITVTDISGLVSGNLS